MCSHLKVWKPFNDTKGLCCVYLCGAWTVPSRARPLRSHRAQSWWCRPGPRPRCRWPCPPPPRLHPWVLECLAARHHFPLCFSGELYPCHMPFLANCLLWLTRYYILLSLSGKVIFSCFWPLTTALSFYSHPAVLPPRAAPNSHIY